MKKQIRFFLTVLVLVATLILLVACGGDGDDFEKDVTTKKPRVTTAEPAVTTTAPATSVTMPVITTTNPAITTAKPTVTTTAPGSAVTSKPVVTSKPTVTTTEKVVTTKPVVTAAPVTTTVPVTTAPVLGEGLAYRVLDDGTYEVTGIGTCTDSVLVIPGTYNGKAVTRIGGSAFYGCSGLTSVTIPNSVTSIGGSAFSGCSNITYASIPALAISYIPKTSLQTVVITSGTRIGYRAFYDCTSLTSVTIPDSVTSIGREAFLGCSGLIQIVNGVSYVDSWVIDCDSSITFVSLRENTVGIADYAFYDCTSLTSVTIPDAVTSIGSNAFYGCNSLTSVTIGDSVTGIASDAFYGCGSLEAVYISDLAAWYGIEFGSSSANPLYYADNLYINGEIPSGDIVIPDGVTTIPAYTFRKSHITSVMIPDSVTSIGGRAFYDCTSLEAVYISDLAAWCGIQYSDYFANPLYYAHNLYLEGTLVTELVIPDSVTSIGGTAFYDCRNLTSVTIPDSVTSIGYGAFSHCDSLTSVTIPDSVTSIGEEAFYSCDSLTSVTIGDSVTSIGSEAFQYCDKLVEVRNLSDLTISKGSSDNGYIGYYAFNIITDTTTPSKIWETSDGYLFYEDGETCYLLDYTGSETDLTLPADCHGKAYEIYRYAFYDCSSLTSVTIPDSVTSIGSEAFRGCDSLTSVTIGDSVTSIGGSAFYNCTSLEAVYISDLAAWCGIDFNTSDANPLYYAPHLYLNNTLVTELVIPDSVTSIGSYTFYDCDSLTSVTIPDSVTSIGSEAFQYCDKLVEVRNLSDLTISKGSSDNGYIGYYALNIITDTTTPSKIWETSDGYLFYEDGETCYLLDYTGSETDLTLHADCHGKAYEIYRYAFYDCSSLTSVTIPDSVTRIGDYAFYNCSSLVSVTISDSVTSIGSNVFYGCSNLQYNEYDNVYYLGDAKSLYIVLVKVKDTSITSVTIPDSVTCIDSNAFSGCSNITYASIPALAISYIPKTSLQTVVITSGISIGDWAFYSCDSLTSVTIGDSVTSIGKYAFCNCSSLTSVTIPDSVTCIGREAFLGCSGLIQIVNGVSYVDSWVIDCDSSITFVSLRENTVGIADYAFYDCTSLTSVTIPDAVTSIGSNAFYGCNSLTSVTIGDSVTNIGSYAFSGCRSLEAVYINDLASWCGIWFGSYDANPLYYADNLYINGEIPSGDIVIPDGVTTIPEYTFRKSHITSVTIPDSVTSIGSGAFSGCSSLKAVYISDLAVWCGIIFGGDAANPLYYAGNLYLDGTLVTELVIPDSVTSIGSGAFYYCNSLTSVTIGDSVTSIGGSAFYNCSSLEAVYISDLAAWCGIEFGSSSANPLYYADNLYINGELPSGDIVIPDGVTTIPAYTFRKSHITSVTIPDSVTSIGSGAFSGCSSLKAVYISDLAVWCGIIFGGDAANPLYYAQNLYLEGTLVTELVIPDSVTSIGGTAFYDCRNLTSVTIPDSVTSIGYGAFSHCDSLTSVTIGDSVTSIGYEAFYGCSGLTSVTIGDSVTSIGDRAFSGCHKLVEVRNLSDLTITKGSTDNGNIGYYALDIYADTTTPSKLWETSDGYLFYEDGETCYLLGYTGSNTDLTLPADCHGKNYEIYKYAIYNRADITSVTIGSSVTSIGDSAFSGYSNITYASIPTLAISYIPKASLQTVIITSGTSIGSRAFYNCDSLTTVTIPDSVTSIGSYAFYWCRSLTTVTIGDSVTSIGSSAFKGCRSLTSVTIPDSVTSIGGSAFEYCYKLVEVRNLSDLTISKGSSSNGYIGYYALNIITDATTPSKIWETSDGYLFYENGETCYLLGYTGSNTDLTLPADCHGKEYEIYRYAFSGCDSLTSVTIPGSVTNIGDYAFSGCDSLTSVTIGDSVTSIGDEAFRGCSSLTSVTIPDSVTSIGGGAFSGCSQLESITLPVIGNSKFAISASDSTLFGYLFGTLAYEGGVATKQYYNSSSYVTYYIPASLKTVTITGGNIFYGAFYNCSSLLSVTIPDSVTSIGSYAFYGCTNLFSVCNLSGLSITKGSSDYGFVGYYAFDVYADATEPALFFETEDGYYFYERGEVCVLLKYTGCDTALTLPADCHGKEYHIYKNAFKNLKALTSVEITGEISIGGAAFYGCTGLTTVTIGDSVTGIASDAFYGCGSLEYNEYDNAYYLGNSDNPYVVLIKAKDTAIASVTIHENTKLLLGDAFKNCASLAFVKVGNSVKSIGYNAFYGCTKLVEVCNLSELEIVKGSTAHGYVAYYAIFVHEDATAAGSLFETDDGFLFYEDGDVCYLIGYTGSESVLTLPTDCHGKAYEIYKDAFKNFKNLTAVTIPDAVTSIGSNAFYGCSGLTSVAIGDGVTSIGGGAFYGCGSLEAVYISDLAAWCGIDFNTSDANPLYYAHNLYRDNTLVTSVTIPDSVTSIGGRAFLGCSSLTSVTIPDSVTSIGDYAFYNCSSLVSVTISDSVTSIGSNVFYGCSNLQYNEYDNVYYLGDAKSLYIVLVKVKDTSITSVTIPDSVTCIDSNAFSGCSNITYASIPALAISYIPKASLQTVIITSGTSIGYGAFEDCSSLTSVTIGDSVTSIGGGAFYDCTSLKAVYISNLAAWCGIVFDGLQANPLYYAPHLYLNNTLVTELVIPDSVTNIADYAFYNCSSLLSVTIPDSVTNIGECAFYNCDSLTTVTIGDSVTNIGERAFYGCDNLTTMAIPDTVTSIGNDAFLGCSSLQYNEYSNAYYLGNSKNPYVVLIKAKSTSISSVTIPDGTKVIYDGAFAYCDSLSSVKIPDSVTSIGERAFQDCSELVSVTIGKNVKYIGAWAFDGAFSPNLTLNKPMSVYISDLAAWCEIEFGNESANPRYFAHRLYVNGVLTTQIVIPDGVTKIGAYAFCVKGLTPIIANGFEIRNEYNNFLSVTIPESVVYIGHGAFDCWYSVYADSAYSTIFENTSGWQLSEYVGDSIVFPLDSDLSDAAMASKFLRDTYADYDWTRN